ncbi:MAG: hypothetical protein P1U89_14085 [Verrucomicrobiales bacterium]|nr:hypothetical protein [Verrucomicrobiales bacterium]
MSSPLTNWVIALKPEAQPLIEQLNLKQAPGLSGGGFPVFQNPENTDRLIISGVGKINAAAAVSWLGQFSEKWQAWINYGIAGHQSAGVGSVFRAGRITDQATGRSWYPTAVWPKKEDRFEVAEIMTVDRPTAVYPENAMIEMEASGFVSTALRFASSELIQVIKVVSDNESTNLTDLTPKSVRALSAEAIPAVIEWKTCLESISKEEIARLSNPEGWESTVEQFRFTETEKHILKRLISRAHTMEKFHSVEDWLKTQHVQTGKGVIKSLESLLSNTKSAEDRS